MEEMKNPSPQEKEKEVVVLSDCEKYCGRGWFPGCSGNCMGCSCNPDDCY